MTQDFEDIVFVLENRQSIWVEMNAAEEKLRDYLQTEFTLLRANRYIREWIDAHSDSSSPQKKRFDPHHVAS